MPPHFLPFSLSPFYFHSISFPLSSSAVVRSFELNGGRALGATPLTHSSPIHAIALSQCSASLAETLLVLHDAEKNVYITPATRNSLKKVSSNVVSVLWSTSHDALLCLESGAVAMHLWPMAYLTAPSEAKHLILNVKDETLHENGRRLLWFHGSMASLQKKSGALKTFLVSNMAPLLLDGVVRQNWQDTIRLCRVISEKEFWYLLAVTSVGPKGNLEASEEALAALGHMDKLQHIRRIKDIVSTSFYLSFDCSVLYFWLVRFFIHIFARAYFHADRRALFLSIPYCRKIQLCAKRRCSSIETVP